MRLDANDKGKWSKWWARAAVGGAALALFSTACSSAPPPETARQPETRVGVEAPVAETSSAPAVEIYAVKLREAAPGSQVEVDTSSSLVWTTYRDSDDHLVVELPNSRPSSAIADLFTDKGLVESVAVELDDSGDRPLTRLVLKTRAEAEHSVHADGTRLLVGLIPIDTAWDTEQLTEVVPEEARGEATLVAEEPLVETTDQDVMAEQLGAPTEPLVVPGPAPRGVPASRLQNVEVMTVDSRTVVRVLGDGEFYYSTFTLQAPERFVVDLIGVVNTAPLSSITSEGSVVDRVRVAQFKPQPELVSRVVVDLSSPAAAQVERLPDGLSLTFTPADTTTLVEDVSSGLMPPAGESPAETAELEVTWMEPAESGAEGMGAVENDTVGSHDLPTVAVSGQVHEERDEMTPPALEEEPVASFAQAASDTSIYASELDTGASVAAVDTGSGVASFEEQMIGGAPKKYRGEPMTMSLKDADIKDVLRSFAQISGLNVVVQPGVGGSVTVELANVPWDQALEQILKINGLGYQLEGNIMRIAPTSQLRAEAEEEQRLQQAQSLSIPLTTIIRRVSYAEAGAMAGLLQASVMSQRGSVVVDPRTNTLIIKELPGFMEVVIAIIETLDTPEPQVQIEARIIETTKSFGRTLGIQWGFQAVADAEHGNTTGLMFPNDVTAEGSVNLLSGGANGLLDITMGNVLDTFRLDMTLQAAEDEGLINILSAPRVTTLNNQQASIQSGLQIPIQTVANNTVSVQFVNATLRLDVTPHVTAEGTVLLDINIQKREPLLALAVVGATNAPISTKDARTRVIVRDGGTTVIGGIYKVTEDQGEDRVPILANIPILGHLFKNRRRNDENEELLIFITPRVVKL